MAKTVIGLFDTMEHAQQAVRDLEAAGFGKDRVSVIARQTQAGTTARTAGPGGEETAGGAGTGAAIGAGTGAVIGGGTALLASLGVLAIPGIGPILAAGPIVALLTGAGVGAGVGALAGGLIGALTDVGVPEEQARIYEEGVRRGGVLVTVMADDRSVDRAADILDKHGAVDIEERAAAYGMGAATAASRPQPRPAPAPPAGRAARDVTPGQNIREQVVQEELIVGKRPVARGGVRVFTHTSERPVEERVKLRDETVHVDRHPVDRPASEADIARPGDREVVVREMDEEPVVGKRARVVEEVVVSKDVREREEKIRDTVRRRDVDVRPAEAGAPDAFARYENDFRGHYNAALGRSGMPYEQYAPAYRYGGQLAGDQRYADRDWSAIRSEARADWERRNPGSGWDRIEQAVQYGWDKVRGRT